MSSHSTPHCRTPITRAVEALEHEADKLRESCEGASGRLWACGECQGGDCPAHAEYDGLKKIAADLEALLSETAPPDVAAMRSALEPFADVGQWLFARPEVPDSETMVELHGLNGQRGGLTRGHFKAAHTALHALPSAEVQITANDRRWRFLEHGCQWVSWTPIDGETVSFDPRDVKHLKAMRTSADETSAQQVALLREEAERMERRRR